NATQKAKIRRRPNDSNIADAGVAALISKFAPPAMLINENHEAVHLYGEVSTFLHNKEGAASLQVNRILPDSLTPIASALLYKAERDKSTLVSDCEMVVVLGGDG
ncbi:chemotaxis protein CheR, partial [bacterium]|nr:chemotaxis protein CheR [bacterium]